MATDLIETQIKAGNWKSAQDVIEQQLKDEPDDHWLWSRLSGVKYEQRDYKGALAAADRALEIVPDCPLALWSRAGALDMLGKTREAAEVYKELLHRGGEEIINPDEDAEECWEGKNWTKGLLADCIFRTAGCLVKMGKEAKARKRPEEATKFQQKAAEFYQIFLNLLDYERHGIYSREDAEARLKKLVPITRRTAVPAAVERVRSELEEVMG